MPSYCGKVKVCTADDTGNTVWKIEFFDPSSMALPNDVAILVDSRVEYISQSDFDSRYTPEGTPEG